MNTTQTMSLIDALTGMHYGCVPETRVAVVHGCTGYWKHFLSSDAQRATLRPRKTMDESQPAGRVNGSSSVWARIGSEWRACDLMKSRPL